MCSLFVWITVLETVTSVYIIRKVNGWKIQTNILLNIWPAPLTTRFPGNICIKRCHSIFCFLFTYNTTLLICNYLVVWVWPALTLLCWQEVTDFTSISTQLRLSQIIPLGVLICHRGNGFIDRARGFLWEVFSFNHSEPLQIFVCFRPQLNQKVGLSLYVMIT